MPQSTVPMDFSSATAALKQHQQSIAEDRYLSDPHARVHSLHRQRAQLPALATGLAQGPVHEGGTGTHGSFPTGSSLPSSDRAPGLDHLPTLPQRRRDGRASGVPVSGPRSCQETPSLPIRDASGATWNGLGWTPVTGNERESEREQ